jgi:hypothetical protein
MEEENYGSFFPQRKALEALTNLLSLQCEEMRLIVKELPAGEWPYEMLPMCYRQRMSP